MTLKKSPVIFNEENHTYHLANKQLKGITPIISWLFPKTYDGIPEEVLKKAAEAGRLVHLDCQLYDEDHHMSNDPQLQEYIELTKDLSHLTSEYLVSDDYNFASCIDKVYCDKEYGCVILGDIKCTSQLHIENVTVQLSIYAALFEDMNPDFTVTKLIAIHLPKPQYGRGKVVELQRLPKDLCFEIMAAYLQEPWTADEEREKVMSLLHPAPAGDTLTEIKSLAYDLSKVEREISILKERSDTLRADLLALMQQSDTKKYDDDNIIVTRKLAATRQTLDSKKVKELHPDIYAECVKEQQVNESLTIKIK